MEEVGRSYERIHAMNVLVATDGSKYGRWGLNWVAKLPLVEPAQVLALYVLDNAKLRLPFRTKLETQRIEARSAKTLTDTKKQLTSLKLKGTVRREQGAVAPVILNRAPKRHGLLVVGSQGLDALDRFTLGSVSTKLIQHATSPVLVVKNEAAPLRRITLATDGSDASAKALKFVLTKFQPDGSTGKGRRVPIHVSVIHVMVPSPLAPFDIGTTIPWTKYRGLKVKETGRRLVEQTVQKLIEAGFAAEPLCQSGNAADTILKVASKQHTDLIVMGAKGLGAIDRFLLGSVSTRVVQHANCSVLVVR
jgi:nucleotide-binding universal stress UspA family protein